MTPIAPTPLDYVPADRLAEPPRAIRPTRFTPQGVRNGLIAAGVAGALVGAFILAPAACVALAVMVGAVHVGNRICVRLNKRDEQAKQDAVG